MLCKVKGSSGLQSQGAVVVVSSTNADCLKAVTYQGMHQQHTSSS